MNNQMTLEEAIKAIKNTTVNYDAHTLCHFVNGYEDTVSGFIILWNGEDRAMDIQFKSPRPYAEQVIANFEQIIAA